METKYRIIIHGGAGTILPSQLTPEKEADYQQALKSALLAGHAILKSGGSAIEAVTVAVASLEDCPLFNAGKGSVFTHDKKNEMDASIMDGSNLQAGAVSGVSSIKNPIQAALAVMNHSEHVLLTGSGAEQFAAQQGLKLVDSSYFFTEFRHQQLLQVMESEKATLDHNVQVEVGEQKFGTVGAVALDQHGNLAAATSTGGLTNKRFGRVGDSPIIGAGTYANNETCAVSATGYGEFFMRYVVAYDVSARMAYQGLSLAEAAKAVVETLHKAEPETGGLVAIDKDGNFCLEFNTPGMYRGYMLENGEVDTKIYR
jgi:beta-aspartyl-peptidase (threonine type)